MSLSDIPEVVFPRPLYQELVGHALRKLRAEYLPDEEQAPKAYGLVGGQLCRRRGEVTHVFPLKRNLRDDPALRDGIQLDMEEVAVRSETPFDRRAWVTDPREVLSADRVLEAAGAQLFGGYHMHRVAWAHDPLRDTCTDLDTRLTANSGLWVFILSMVDPERPRLRTYFEGDNRREASVRVLGP